MSDTVVDSTLTEKNRPKLLTFLFGFCMFSTGGTGLVNEYVLATMTTYILGNSIEQFSIIIASMMLMMGVSGLVQEKISDDNLIKKFIGIEVTMALLGGFAPIIIYAAYGYTSDHFLFIHYFFVLSIGFLIGFEIPIVMRIINQHGIGIKKNLKIVYAMDYIGAFVFAIIWVKFLLKNFPLTEISFIVASFNFCVAAITVGYLVWKNLVKPGFIINLLIPVTIGALVFGYLSNREWSLSMEQKFYDDPMVYSKTTKYQHLVVTEHKKTGDIRLYINGNTQFSSIDEARYHDLLVHPAMTSNYNNENVLIFGGGDGLALREVLKYKNVKSVTLVDLDPGMVKFASTNKKMRELNKDSFSDARVFIPKSTGVQSIGVEGIYLETTSNNKPATEYITQVEVYNIDADKFVNELHDKKWGVIIIDFPDPSSVELAKLYSREFYTKLQWLMADDAIASIQSTSPYHAKEAYLTIQRTMESTGLKTLPYHQNVPSFGDWGYFLAWKSDKTVRDMMIHMIDIEFKVPTKFITPHVFMAATVFGKKELTTDETCVNSLMFPCLVDLYLNHSWTID